MIYSNMLLIRNLELRKVKTLGPNKFFKPVLPGQFFNAVLNTGFNPTNEEENEEEQLPNKNIPPFEPLVLWTSPDSDHKIEVKNE